VGTLLEKLGFRQLVEETLKVKRQTRAMPAYQFILAMVLAYYVGFGPCILRLPSWRVHQPCLLGTRSTTTTQMAKMRTMLERKFSIFPPARFPVNQIRRKASWVENFCCPLWMLPARKSRPTAHTLPGG
jgi:hypothetical protein